MSPDLRQVLGDLAARRFPDDGPNRISADVDRLLVTARRRRARRRAVQTTAGVAAVVTVAVAAVTAWGAARTDPPRRESQVAMNPQPTGTPGPSTAPEPTPGEPVPCAELPVQADLAADYEGWWNASPADAEANVLTDPADWPTIMRDHPRTVLVDTATGKVVSAWDRLSCESVTATAPPPDPAWPPDSVVVLDADTGAVVDAFPRPPAP